MVKGVNKSIIEVNDTGSAVFEKVVFYISPKYGNLSPKKLLSETDKFTFDFEKNKRNEYMSLRKRMLKKRRLLAVGIVAGCAVFFALLAYLIF